MAPDAGYCRNRIAITGIDITIFGYVIFWCTDGLPYVRDYTNSNETYKKILDYWFGSLSSV